MGGGVVYRAVGLGFGVCSAAWPSGSQPWGTAGLWMGSALGKEPSGSPGSLVPQGTAEMASRLGGHPGRCPCAGSFVG